MGCIHDISLSAWMDWLFFVRDPLSLNMNKSQQYLVRDTIYCWSVETHRRRYIQLYLNPVQRRGSKSGVLLLQACSCYNGYHDFFFPLSSTVHLISPTFALLLS